MTKVVLWRIYQRRRRRSLFPSIFLFVFPIVLQIYIQLFYHLSYRLRIYYIQLFYYFLSLVFDHLCLSVSLALSVCVSISPFIWGK